MLELAGNGLMPLAVFLSMLSAWYCFYYFADRFEKQNHSNGYRGDLAPYRMFAMQAYPSYVSFGFQSIAFGLILVCEWWVFRDLHSMTGFAVGFYSSAAASAFVLWFSSWSKPAKRLEEAIQPEVYGHLMWP